MEILGFKDLVEGGGLRLEYFESHTSRVRCSSICCFVFSFGLCSRRVIVTRSPKVLISKLREELASITVTKKYLFLLHRVYPPRRRALLRRPCVTATKITSVSSSSATPWADVLIGVERRRRFLRGKEHQQQGAQGAGVHRGSRGHGAARAADGQVLRHPSRAALGPLRQEAASVVRRHAPGRRGKKFSMHTPHLLCC